MPTPRPSPSPTPTPTPTSPSPSAATDALVVDEADIARHLDALAAIADDHSGIRAAGTSGYDASADYVAAELEKMGLAVERQPVHFAFFRETAPVSLSVDGDTWTGIEWLHAMLYSASGHVTGGLDVVGQDPVGLVAETACEPDSWDGFERGSIALVFSGPCLRRDQVMLAQDAGAVAFVALAPTLGANRTLQPTLIDPSGIEIPAIICGQEPAAALLAAAEAGNTAEITVDVETGPTTVDNVFGELGGSSAEVVMLGGHLDSVLDGPGLNDNGSGVATLLALARAMGNQPAPERTVRFAFWAAEEFGAHGSRRYVYGLSDADKRLIKAYINLDMVGSPNAARFVYDGLSAPDGSTEITQLLLEALSAAGTPGMAIETGASSDHAPFMDVGIPVGGLFSGIDPLTAEQAQLFAGEADLPADPCFHLACDDRINVDAATATMLGSAVAELIEELAY